MGQIANLFGKLLLDDTGFEADVVKSSQKAADAATKTLGQRVSGGLKKSLAVGLGAVAGATALALGVAAKGALELQNIQADFQAQTGASADEAARAAKVINRVAGEERTSLEAVSAVAIKVRKDMGLTGPEADKMTQAIVRFARVTKQDAVAAVTAYDDIMDAWNLTAAQTLQVQDKLLVSNQKYGGSITENQKALAELAPTLRAANLSVDDGIGLLNLFASSGVDSATAITGMQKALTKVKSPAQLQRLIDDIIATEDPFKRAQKAVDLFGAKAGAKLANVLKPGIGSLQDFQISAAAAAGATDKAADIIDSTFTGRVQKAISEASAALRGFGADFGPALTGAASLATLLSPLLGGLARELGPKLIEIFASAGAQAGDALSAGLQSVWSGAGGTVIGNNIASRVENIFDPTKSTLIGNAWRKVGGKAATVYLKALILGDSASALFSAGITRLSSSSAVTGALQGVGKIWGSTLGKATVLGFAAVVIVDLLDQLNKVQAQLDAQSKSIGESITKEISAGTLEGLKTSKAALEKGIRDIAAISSGGLFFGDEQRALEAQLKKVNDAIEQQYRDIDTSVNIASKHIGQSLDTIPAHADPPRRAFISLADKAKTSFGTVKTQSQLMADRLKANAGAIAAAIHNLTDKLLGEATALINGYYDPIIAQEDLRVQKDQVAANKVALAATKAGSAQRHQAELTLTQSQQALDQTRANLLASGQLSAKEQKAWLAELKKRYKEATGAAKRDIAGLIASIIALQGVDRTGIHIYVSAPPGAPHRAAGGRVAADRPYIVGEDRSGRNGELFVPDVSGAIVPHNLTAALLANGGTTVNLTVNAGSDVTPLAARRLGQTILDTVANGLREQTARTGSH